MTTHNNHNADHLGEKLINYHITECCLKGTMFTD